MWIAGFDSQRVAEGNVAVDLTVNEQDGNFGGGNDIFWRDLLHVDAIFPAGIEEREFDNGAEERASEPGAEMKRLAHPIVGDLAKIRERGLGDDGAEARLDGERLQELSGTHGFSKSENAARVIAGEEKVEPLVNVVAFEKAEGR